MNQDDFLYCKNEFKWFLDIQFNSLKGNINTQIDEFCHNFCFDDLYNYDEISKLPLNEEEKNRYNELSYGSNSKNVWDSDDTHLARIIYFLIHNNKDGNKYAIPGLDKFSDLGSGYKYKYRGDTINTYSTLFGSKNQGYERFFISQGFEEQKVKNFRRKYVTIGNFMLLPAKSVQLDKNKRKWDSLNTFRGINERYRDYFDLFISRLVNFNQDFEPWIAEDDLNYFIFVKNIDRYIEANMLEDYFDMKTKSAIHNLFNHNNTNAPLFWFMNDKIDDSLYRKFALNYINKATDIINNRAGKICNILKSLYD